MHKKDPYHELKISSEITLSYVGPHIKEGPKPTLFYFALSKEDSLLKDPYNQLVQFLPNPNIRTFSMTLPGHEPPRPPEKALKVWAESYLAGEDILTSFFSQVKTAIDFLENKDLLLKKKLAIAGLSRGGFICSHIAAMDSRIDTILQFAPLTRIEHVQDFSEITKLPTVQQLSLDHLIQHLYNRSFRFYIGNHDTRVGTHHCFNFVEKLVKEAVKHQIRSPKIELFITSSVGYMGHGTLPHIFKSGAQWINKQLNPSI